MKGSSKKKLKGQEVVDKKDGVPNCQKERINVDSKDISYASIRESRNSLLLHFK